jgi:hypothetical protein
MLCRHVLQWQTSKKVTTLGTAELHEKCHALRHRIDSWHNIQQIYMPCIDQVRAVNSASDSSSTGSTSDDDPPSAIKNPEITPLFFPSSISPSFWLNGCISGLVNKERRLNELRHQLRISTTLQDYKKVQVGSSQKMNLQTRTLLSHFHDKTICSAERYSAAYHALSILNPNGDWTMRLRPLNHQKDLQPPCRNDDDESHETRRELSWIWLVSQGGGLPKAVASGEEINDSKL